MNQKFLLLKETEGPAGVEYDCVTSIMCERKDARQMATALIAEDGTFYCVPLGDRIVAATTRVITGVKATRAKAAPNGKPAAKAKKKTGLNPAVKVRTGGDDATGA